MYNKSNKNNKNNQNGIRIETQRLLEEEIYNGDEVNNEKNNVEKEQYIIFENIQDVLDIQKKNDQVIHKWCLFLIVFIMIIVTIIIISIILVCAFAFT